jgi:N-glycosylase/DNA lyase
VSSPPAARLEHAVVAVAELASRLLRPVPWQRATERFLWQELVTCLLGSRVRSEMADAAATQLSACGLLDDPSRRSWDDHFEADVQRTLSVPMSTRGAAGRPLRYRYPTMRANHLRRTGAALYGAEASLCGLLRRTDERDARRALVAAAVGIGPKQASLFLRNVGRTDDLAVLDAHVLRFMAEVGLGMHTPASVGQLRGYERVEAVLASYGTGLGFPLGCLDIAIWLVMRAHRPPSQ